MLGSQSDGIPLVQPPLSLARRILLAAIVFLGIGFLIFATAGGNETGRVSGAGSTFVNPILQEVSTRYQGYLAADRIDVARQQGGSGDWVSDGQGVDYDPVGSVGGLVRLSDPKLNFAASKVPLSPAELTERGLLQFPIVLGAAAPIVNLDLDGTALTLDAATLAAIYAGTITDWSDPAIAALNPALTLPALPIAVRHRSDGSGTTYTFTGFLAGSDAWTAGQAAQLDWPTGSGAQGSSGVIAAVKATPGAIGYVEVGQARRAGLVPVRLVNRAGQAVEPSAPSIRAAARGTQWTADTGFSAPLAASNDPTAWPMAATVYAIVRRNGASDTDRTLRFFRFFYAEAERSADALGFVALPAAAIRAVEEHWASELGFSADSATDTATGAKG